MSSNDFQFMQQALDLAALGAVFPNPKVGCVIVKDGKCISEGYHSVYGGAHAEIEALDRCLGIPYGATWYITLEPCSHSGKTPPCVDAIIETKPTRVVIAMRDPNPLVKKRDSIQLLRDAGIAVELGCLEKEAMFLNRVFIKTITKKVPYITLKVAQSLDGKIALASGESSYITNDISRKRVHEIRNRVDGILVGINTVLMDNPKLDVRYDLLNENDSNPDLFIFDSEGKTHRELALLSVSNRRVFVCVDSQKCSEERQRDLSTFVNVWLVDGLTRNDKFKSIIDRCYKEGYGHLLVEGGAQLYKSALESKVVDEAYIYIAPLFMGENNAIDAFSWPSISSMSSVPTLKGVTHTSCGSDIEIHGFFSES